MPTPYAIYAETAGSALSGPGGGGDSGWTISGSDIYHLTGNVGIGTSSPSAKLEVNGQVKITGGSPGAGKVLTSDAGGLATWQTPTSGGGPDGDWAISGNNMYAMPSGNVGIGTMSPGSKLEVAGSSSRAVVQGTNTGAGVGVQGESSSNHGVVGKSTMDDGIHGESANGYGVYGSSNSGSGVYGTSASGNAGYFSGKAYFSGNVGIGTENATQLLHVYGSSNPRILVEAPSNSTPELNLKRGTNSYNLFMGSGNDLHFFNNGTKITFTHDGKVGIGTTEPYHKLDVVGPDTMALINALNTEGTGITGEGVIYGVRGDARSDSGEGVHGYCVNGTGVKGYSQYGKGVHGLCHDGYGVYGESSRNYGVYGVSDSTTGIFGEGTGSGKAGVYGVNDDNNGYGVHGSGGKSDFFATHGTYHSGSSIRWKRDIEPIDDALDKVLGLRGVSFTWDEQHGGRHTIGMIAEEVGEVLPEIVSYEENGVDATGMDYSKLTPLLVEAIKELKAENDSLKQRLEALESRINQDRPVMLTEVQNETR
jgi:hypothetical protein